MTENTNPMKRIFLAISIPPTYQTKEVLTTLQQALHDSRITWVDPDHMHLTIKFFGDTPPHRIRDIIRVTRLTTEEISPFRLFLEGCGTFGPPKEPRVIWMGTQPSDTLKSLYQQLHKRLKTVGYEPDKQNFSPHITLGRIKKLMHPEMLKQMLMVYKSSGFGSHDISSISLYESILHPDGPEYNVLEEFGLM